MALQSCYECNKEISTKAIICPQCGAPQNPVSGLVDKAKDGFLGKTFNKVKNNIRQIARNKEVERIIEENLEKVVQKEIIEGHSEVLRGIGDEQDWASTFSKFQKLFKFPCLHLLLNGSDDIAIRGIAPQVFSQFDRDANKEIQDLMEKMEIESGREMKIWWKLEEIRKKIEEKDPTILSRFRPKE